MWLRTPAIWLLTTAASISLPGSAPLTQPEQASKQDPAAVAHQFLKAFEEKDFAAIRPLFAPGATVSGIWLAQAGAPRPAQSSAEEWMQTAQSEVQPLKNVRIQVLETSQHSFEQGAVVSVRFVQTGNLSGRAFSNHGVESYLMTPTEEGWKILHYAYMERFAFDG